METFRFFLNGKNMVNERTPKFPPLIEPLPGTENRPRWSVMIPTYNCSKYLKACLESVLIQSKSKQEMQITVIDDFSTDDDIEKLVEEVGMGRIEFHRQHQNVGSLRNFETCIKKSRGELIHILHGDDLVKPGFYNEIEHLFTRYSSIGAAFTGLSNIDEDGELMEHYTPVQEHSGIIKNWLMEISKCQLLQTCSIVVKRKVYEELGSFFAVHYGEDWEMWVRIASRFQVAYTPQNLALYRVHNNNISSRCLSTGQNVSDIKKVIDITQNYLPTEIRKERKVEARRNFANYFTINAQKIYRLDQNAQVALTQAKAAFMLSRNKETLVSLVKICVKIMIKYKSKS
ncbi:glycosyltransferase family 2 protein [Pedobacter immunditicola]|uniref:glycosyltransferase family 2 protein n=1 Tax=Pedobacter immunditicola TaxID=3133440 RepID=UPI0030A0FC42